MRASISWCGIADIRRLPVVAQHDGKGKIGGPAKHVERIESRLAQLLRTSGNEGSFSDMTALTALELLVCFTEVMQERESDETLGPHLWKGLYPRKRREP
jgi:hypothetical protein